MSASVGSRKLTSHIQNVQTDETSDIDIGDYTTWEYQEEGIFMPVEVAEVLCTKVDGWSQPEEFNLGDPMQLEFSYQCCNECVKNSGKL